MSASEVTPDGAEIAFGLLGLLVSLTVFGGVAASIVYLVVRARRAAERKRALAIALAKHHGFSIDPNDKDPPPQRFDMFGVGHSKKVTNQIWRAGASDSVFDYTYTTGGGRNQRTHRRTCALVALSFDAPHTKIATENFFTTIGRRLGVRDIDTESVRFNEIYRVNGDDERFAVALLDSHAIDWLLRSIPDGPGAVTFELWGPWLLCVTSRLNTEAQFGFHDWARNVPTEFPSVLSSLYPVDHRDGSAPR